MYKAFIEEIKEYLNNYDVKDKEKITDAIIDEIAYKLIYDEYLWEIINNLIQKELDRYLQNDEK